MAGIGRHLDPVSLTVRPTSVKTISLVKVEVLLVIRENFIFP